MNWIDILTPEAILRSATNLPLVSMQVGCTDDTILGYSKAKKCA